jgi:hypothetical protein
VPASSPATTSSAPAYVLSRPVTRRQRDIIQNKICTDGTVAWSAVLAERAASKDTAAPHDYREALRIPHWRDAMET